MGKTQKTRQGKTFRWLILRNKQSGKKVSVMSFKGKFGWRVWEKSAQAPDASSRIAQRRLNEYAGEHWRNHRAKQYERWNTRYERHLSKQKARMERTPIPKILLARRLSPSEAKQRQDARRERGREINSDRSKAHLAYEDRELTRQIAQSIIDKQKRDIIRVAWQMPIAPYMDADGNMVDPEMVAIRRRQMDEEDRKMFAKKKKAVHYRDE